MTTRRGQRLQWEATRNAVAGCIWLAAIGIACADSSSGPTPPDPLFPKFATLTVKVSTTGDAIDRDGYRVVVATAFERAIQPIDANGETQFSRLLPGTYSVWLEGLSNGCVLFGPTPVPVSVAAATVNTIALRVDCTSPGVGTLRVTVTTRVLAPTLNPRFALRVDDQLPQSIPINGTVEIDPILAGSHAVELMANSCFVSFQRSSVPFDSVAVVDVPPNGVAEVRYSVFCIP